MIGNVVYIGMRISRLKFEWRGGLSIGIFMVVRLWWNVGLRSVIIVMMIGIVERLNVGVRRWNIMNLLFSLFLLLFVNVFLSRELLFRRCFYCCFLLFVNRFKRLMW